MISFIGSGLFIGGLIGARLSVLALVPAAALALSIAAVSWGAHAWPPNWSLINLIALLVFLQIGYLGGAGLRLFVAPMWIGKARPLIRQLRAHLGAHQ